MPSRNRVYDRKTTVEPIKGVPGNIDRSVVSDVIDSMMDEDRKRKEEASLSKTERALLIKERKRQSERKANRVGYDIGEELRERIANLANSYGISNSQLAAWILWGGVKELERTNGELLSDYKQPTISLRHEWCLDLEKRKNE